MIRDPVCYMLIQEDHAAATVEYRGRTYHFCAVGCKEEFERDPEKYAARDESIPSDEEEAA